MITECMYLNYFTSNKSYFPLPAPSVHLLLDRLKHTHWNKSNYKKTLCKFSWDRFRATSFLLTVWFNLFQVRRLVFRNRSLGNVFSRKSSLSGHWSRRSPLRQNIFRIPDGKTGLLSYKRLQGFKHLNLHLLYNAGKWDFSVRLAV